MCCPTWSQTALRSEKRELRYLPRNFSRPSMHGFPPTILTTGTRDLLLSNTVRVHRKLRRAGVEATLQVLRRRIARAIRVRRHACRRARKRSAKSHRSSARISESSDARGAQSRPHTAGYAKGRGARSAAPRSSSVSNARLARRRRDARGGALVAAREAGKQIIDLGLRRRASGPRPACAARRRRGCRAASSHICASRGRRPVAARSGRVADGHRTGYAPPRAAFIRQPHDTAQHFGKGVAVLAPSAPRSISKSRKRPLLPVRIGHASHRAVLLAPPQGPKSSPALASPRA